MASSSDASHAPWAERPSVAVVHQDIKWAIRVANMLCRPPHPAKVRIFIDPRAALAKLRDEPPRILLAPRDMPFIDGLGLFEHLAKHHAGVACILLGTLPEGHRAVPPAVVAVPEPLDPVELGRIVKDVLFAKTGEPARRDAEDAA